MAASTAPQPVETAPQAHQERSAPLAANTAPESPADRLVIQAHQASANLRSGTGTETDFTQIIEACRRARASQPSAETARYASELASWAFNRRGELKAEAGRDDEAIRDFDDAIRADPRRWRAIHNRGVLFAQNGNFEKAFDDFNRTIQLQPEFAKAYSNRAALYVIAADLQPALADYTRALELDPNLAVAHRGCGRAFHLLGRTQEAARHFDEAVKLAPEDGYAAACRADLLVDLGRYADARAEYERAIELDSQLAQAYSGSAWLLATCPDSSVRHEDLAIARASKAVELSGHEDVASLDALAAAQASAGDFSAAVGTIRQAVQFAPAEKRKTYEERLLLYQHARPYRLAPSAGVRQASYEAESSNQSSQRWK